MSAILTGAAMLGATVVGAMALTLDDYPMPLVEDGAFVGKIVVGKTAATSDVLGAIDIAASLQADSKVAASVSGGTVNVVGGEEFDKTNLNTYVTGKTLTDTDLAGFADTDTDLVDDTIDYHDEFIVGSSGLGLQTSLTEEDFADEIYMVVEDGGLEYRLVFDDWVNTSLIAISDHASYDRDTLKVDFLGRNLEIISADSNSITVRSSNEFSLLKGDSVTVDGTKITLSAVGTSSVRVTVGGETQVIQEGDSEKFTGGLEVEVDAGSIFYQENGDDNGATLRIGSDIEITADDGDSAETFGEPNKRSEAEWVWNIDLSGSTAGSQYIGLLYNQDRTDLSGDFQALALGEHISTPNNYASVSFVELEEKGDYQDLTIEIQDGIDLAEDNNGDEVDNADGLHFFMDSGDDVFRVGSVSTEEVWVLADGSGGFEIWYADGSDEVNASGETDFTIEIDNEVITVTPPADPTQAVASAMDNETEAWKIDFDSIDTLWFFADVDHADQAFGAADDEESAELQYSQAAVFGEVNIGNNDYDYVTDYGVVIPDTESQFGSGSSFHMMIPENQQMGTIVVSSSGSTVSSDGGDSGAYTVNAFALGAGVLDVDAGKLLGKTPLLVVGGPYVNTIAKDLMGNPTGDQINQFFEAGKAKIKLYEDQNAILVAGYTAQDTLGASYVLADYGAYDFEGMSEVEVLVASLEDLEISAPKLPSSVDELEVQEIVDEVIEQLDEQ